METKNELTVPERAAVALCAAEHEKALLVLATKYADLVEIKNNAARDQVHGAYMELKNTRVAIVDAGKTAREDANAFQKAVIAEVERLTAITEAEEARLKKLRDEYDSAREAEKAAIAAAEKARVDGIRKLIDEIKTCPAECVGRSAAQIQGAIDTMTAHEITLEEFMELAGDAEMAKIAALEKLNEALVAQQAHEAEQARIAAERAELARLRAEAEERERQAEAARREQEAKDRAERERVEAEQRAAQEKAAAAMRAEREEHERRMAAERAELAKQQAEIAAAKAEQERIERERQEAIEAEARRKREAEAAEQARREREAREQAEADARERERRERVQFILNGPGDAEIVRVLAEHYGVDSEAVAEWLAKFIAAPFLAPEFKEIAA